MRLRRHADDWVAQDGQIRPRTDSRGRTGWRNLAIFWMCEQCRNEMPACRETHDTDAMRVELPLRGFATHLAHRFHRILKLGRIAITGAAESISQYKDGEALFIEPERKRLRLSFVDAGITASGNEQHCGAVGLH